MGTRGAYYDSSGAMRDMIQSHLLQLLTLVAMEPPVSMEAEDLSNEKVKVLKSLRPIPEEKVEDHAFRAQYTAGVVAGRSVPGYLRTTSSKSPLPRPHLNPYLSPSLIPPCASMVYFQKIAEWHYKAIIL